MKASFDSSSTASRTIDDESVALASWYDSQPAVRHLWGIKDARKLRVVVVIEPTVDSDDIYPVWLANAKTWTSQLRSYTRSHVELEFTHGPPCRIEIDVDSVVIADLFWRDPTVTQPLEES